MLGEFNADAGTDNVYLSTVVHEANTAGYLGAQREAFESGNPDTLAAAFESSGVLRPTQDNGNTVNIPQAAKRLAGGQFMAYYIRAVAYRAVQDERSLEIYRARESANPRPESEAKIGTRLDPSELLADLRDKSRTPWTFAVLPEVSSGLSVRLVD